MRPGKTHLTKHLWKALPVAAFLTLAACGEDQAAQAPEEAPPPVAEAPEADAPAPQAPADEAPAMAEEAPAATADDLPRTADAPPTPSAIFEEGADALGDIDETVHSVFADAPFDAGRFESEGYRLDIDEEGDFRLEMLANDRVLHGDLRVYGDMFTMSNIAEDTDPGEFPMTCLVTAAPDGFELAADGPSCDMFDGVVFARVTE